MYKISKICPYCGSSISLKSNSIIYGKKLGSGYVYICNDFPRCDSYVGTHTNKNPYGRLANKELRKMKQYAHVIFDFLWKWKKKHKNDRYARKKAYLWLSGEMNKSVDDTHIGYFNKDETTKVMKICLPILIKIVEKYDLKELDLDEK